MTVLVTGAAGGIGRATAAAFRPERVLAQDLVAAAPGAAAIVIGDLLDPGTLDDIEEAVASAGVDTVVAAHGIAGAGSLRAISPTDARRIMRINFESVVTLWERLAPYLEASRGTFVAVSSQAGLVSESANGVYSASKSALAGWMRGLDTQTSVRLRVVYPGATSTPLLEDALRGMARAQQVSYDEILKRRNAATPVGRLGKPREIAAAVRWLASLETPQLVEIAVTGGEVLH
jgi:NAD(P)-dependent dehydrogenase (short-subunit alcohol dehydrogenase family)